MLTVGALERDSSVQVLTTMPKLAVRSWPMGMEFSGRVRAIRDVRR